MTTLEEMGIIDDVALYLKDGRIINIPAKEFSKVYIDQKEIAVIMVSGVEK